MSTTLATEQVKQEIDSGYLEFFELKIGGGANNTLYFHDGKKENLSDVVFDGNTYVSLPIMMDGISLNSDGALARPTLTIANVESILRTGSKFKTQMEDGTWGAVVEGSPLVATNFRIDHLVGCTLTRRRTLEKYLTSNPLVEFNKDVYIIDRVASKDNQFVTLELASPFDMGGVRIPSRIVIGKYCPWVYQGARASLPKDDRLGACHWELENQRDNTAGTSSSIFVSDEDEPIMLKSAIEALGSQYFTGKQSTHSINDFVRVINDPVYGTNSYYQSRGDSNTAALTSATLWRVVRFYTAWASDGSASYTVFEDDYRRSSYVYHNNTVWRCLVAHTRSASFTPEPGSSYWTRADLCGKLLKSCKMRYQAAAVTNLTGLNYIASDRPHTETVLPFGAFPGSRKFR